MKIYKLSLLVLLASFAISCSQDTFEDQKVDDSNTRVAIGQYDDSYLGVYKGLFSTNDGLTRGTVIVTLTPNGEGLAQISLSSGELIELKSSNPKLTVDNTVSNLRFSSEGLSAINASLEFSVEGSGVNPVISAVSYDNKSSDILIAKNLSRAPLVTTTGTYVRTEGTGGFPTSGRTWNVMAIGAGNQTYATQIWYGGRLYNTPQSGSQSDCVVNGSSATCDIAGTANILGYAVAWSGTHTYDSFEDNLGCSEVSGTWSAPSYGGSSGTFVSDSNCDDITTTNDVCDNAIAIACGDSVEGYTDLATNTGAPGTCGTSLNVGPGVWYSFTSNSTQGVTVDTFGSEFDTKLGVFSGDCGALVCVGGNDDTGDTLQSQVSFNASSGTTYYVYVTGFESESGTYNLNIACGALNPTFDLDLTCGEFLVDNGGVAGNYSNSTNNTYTIDAGAGNNASLTFSQFNLENTYDFMRIYDGNSVSSPQITMVGSRSIFVTFFGSGFTGTGNGANSLQDQTVVSTGRYLTVAFTSDGSVTSPGFLAPVTCVAGRLAGDNSQQTSETFMPQPSPSEPKIISSEVTKSKK